MRAMITACASLVAIYLYIQAYIHYKHKHKCINNILCPDRDGKVGEDFENNLICVDRKI